MENNGVRFSVKSVNSLLVLVAFMLGMGATWGMFQGKVQANCEKIRALQHNVVSKEVYQADMRAIQRQLDDLKEGQRRILESLQVSRVLFQERDAAQSICHQSN